MKSQQALENAKWTREIERSKRESNEQLDQQEENPKETETIEKQKEENE